MLVSDDPDRTSFPWEALRYGDGEEHWLGLRRPLARWAPLTASFLDRLDRRPFGQGAVSAAVLSPWDADKKAPLRTAKIEAERVADILLGLGYWLVPHGARSLGHRPLPKPLVVCLQRRRQ